MTARPSPEALEIVAHATRQLHRTFPDRDPSAALVRSAAAILNNLLQSILRENGLPDSRPLADLLAGFGVEITEWPLGRWSSSIRSGESRSTAGQLWEALLGVTRFYFSSADGRRIRDDLIAGSLQHACWLLVDGNDGPERWRHGHNLYPIPIHRPDWTVAQAARYLPGAPIDLPFYELTGNGNAPPGLCGSGREPAGCLVPVHPLATLKSRRLKRFLASKHARVARRQSARLLLSIRTVRLADRDLKLPIDTWITSASRLIKPEYYRTSVIMSSVVSHVLDVEQPADWSVQVDSDAGFLDTGTPDPLVGLIERGTSEIDKLGDAMCAADFLGDPDLVGRSIAAHGGLHPFLQRYMECVAAPAIRLAAGYGVFVEPHLQNVVLGFSPAGVIERAVIRDLDNIYLHLPWAESGGVSLGASWPYCWLQQAPLDRCIASFRHALRDAHLSEMLISAARVTGADPEWLLREMHHTLSSHVAATASSRRELVLGSKIFLPGGGVKRLLDMHLRRSTHMLFDAGLGGSIAETLRDEA